MKYCKPIFFTLFRAATGICLLLFLGSSGAFNWSSLWGLVSAWPITLVAFMLLAAGIVVSASRLCVLVKPLGLYLSLSSSVRLSLIGVFFNSCLPGSASGDVVKIFYAAKGNDGRRTEVTTIMLLDRAIGMFVLVMYPLIVAPLFPRLVASSMMVRGLLWSAAAVAGAMVGGMVIISSERVRESRLNTSIFAGMPLGDYARQIFTTVHAYREHFGALLTASGISFLAHTMSIGVILLAVEAVTLSGATWEMSILVPIGFLANTLPVTPGGLGVGEAAFNALFAAVGLKGGAEGLLAWRVLMMMIGSLGFGLYVQGRKRYVHEWQSSYSLRRPHEDLEATEVKQKLLSSEG